MTRSDDEGGGEASWRSRSKAVAELTYVLMEELQAALRAIERDTRHHASGLQVSDVIVRVGQRAGEGERAEDPGWMVELPVERAARPEPGVVTVEPMARPMPVIVTLPISSIHGVNRDWSRRLAGVGIQSIGDLLKADPLELTQTHGRLSLGFHMKARLAALDAPEAPRPTMDGTVDTAVLEKDAVLAVRWSSKVDTLVIRNYLRCLDLSLVHDTLRMLRLSHLWPGK